jgi:hypothetical protein
MSPRRMLKLHACPHIRAVEYHEDGRSSASSSSSAASNGQQPGAATSIERERIAAELARIGFGESDDPRR